MFSFARNNSTAIVYSADADGTFDFTGDYGDSTNPQCELDIHTCGVGLSDIDNRVSDGIEIWELDFDGYRKWFPAEEAQTILHNYGHPDFQREDR